jgi:hypothetical protein
MNQFDGPIPGENYTSDTKNYAWHRPPEFDDIDKAIDYIGKRLTTEENAVGLLTMIESGLPLTDLTQMFLMSGVGAGKWTLDYALLLAGPVCHIMLIMAKAYGLKYNLGFDNKEIAAKPPTAAFFDAIKEINSAKAAAAGRTAMDQIADIQQNTSDTMKNGSLVSKTPKPKFNGFMNSQPQPSTSGAVPQDEQQKMLGGM